MRNKFILHRVILCCAAFICVAECHISKGIHQHKVTEGKLRHKTRGKSGFLESIIQQALLFNPTIRAENFSLMATDDMIHQAFSGYGPTIDLQAGIGREKVIRHFKVGALNPTLPVDGSLSGTRTNVGITIRQMLFDGMATAARIRRSWHQNTYAKNKLENTRDTTIIEAATAAIDVRRLRRLLDKNTENIEFHKKMKAKVEEQLRVGTATDTDMRQSQARLEDVLVSRATIEGDLRNAEIKFQQIVGQKPPEIPHVIIDKSLFMVKDKEALQRAYESNSSMKVAYADLNIAKSNLDESKSKFMPQVSLEIDSNRQRNVGGNIGTQTQNTALLVARFNAFNSGQDYFKVRENKKRIAEARARVDVSKINLDKIVLSSLNEVDLASKKSAAYGSLIKEKQGVRDNYIQEYDLGKRSLLDILDAATEVFFAQANQITADSSYDINAVVTAVATGAMQAHLKKHRKLPDIHRTDLGGNSELVR